MPSARYAVGAHIGVRLIRVAITDLFANFIYSEIDAFDLASFAEELVEEIIRIGEVAIDESEIDRVRLIGVCGCLRLSEHGLTPTPL